MLANNISFLAIGIILLSLQLLSVVANDEQNFTLAVYSDAACVEELSTVVDNPLNLDPFQCNPYYMNFGASTSIKVLSCTNTCICYEETTGTNDCNATLDDGSTEFGRVTIKEICLNTCRADQNNRFYRLFDFNGECPVKESADEEYECPCTGMNRNCQCSGGEACEIDLSGANDRGMMRWHKFTMLGIFFIGALLR